LNRSLRRRLIVVTGIIIIAIIVVLAVVQGATGSKVIGVAEAASGSYSGQRVQVTGLVVDDSLEYEGDSLVFSIYDESQPETHLKVIYQGAMSATFGNQVTAICTGTMSEDGTLIASQLVTKCPSKYESATDALQVSELMAYGDSVIGLPVKVSGLVKPSSINPVTSEVRLTVIDPVSHDELAVLYEGGLSSGITDGATLVLTGTLDSTGRFHATDIALKE
jgi:cytochrome c-type biogenesis protein CcmE